MPSPARGEGAVTCTACADRFNCVYRFQDCLRKRLHGLSDMTNSFPHLFSPLQLGRRQARNRVFRAATATNLAETFDVSDRLLAHYGALARGGAGVVVT